jgi:iron complex transport system permease protein
MSTQQAAPASTLERPATAGIPLAVAGLLWMAAMLFSARATITGKADAETEVVSTAYALPGAVSASLVAGAAVALAVLTLISRGGRARGATLRFAISTGTGLVLGAVGAVSIITINTEGWVYAVVGGTIAAAATIGGALAGFRAAPVVAAVCWAAIAVFLVGFVLNYVQAPLLNLFGSGSTSASQTTAANWFSLTQSMLSGLAAGLVPYFLLRRTGRRTGWEIRWPVYALAGAGPGLLLIVTEGLARTAGARVINLAGKVSELELTVQQMLGGSRLNNGLIVLFVGAISAIIAIGRTLAPAPDDEPTAPTTEAAAKRAKPATRATAKPTAKAEAAAKPTAKAEAAAEPAAEAST